MDPDDTHRVQRWLEDGEEAEPGGLPASLADVLKSFLQEYKRTGERWTAPNFSAREVLDQLKRGENLGGQPNILADKASDSELIELAQIFLLATKRREQNIHRFVFERRQYPLDPSTLMERFRNTEHPDPYLAVLGTLNTEEVRAFALGLLAERPPVYGAFAALRSSFREEDADAVMSALHALDLGHRGIRHRAALDLLSKGWSMPPALLKQVCEWIYEFSPCSFCRGHATRDMEEGGFLPQYILDEGPWDADGEVREAVAKHQMGADVVEDSVSPPPLY